MERLHIKSVSLFKWTVFLFAIPTLLVLVAAYLIVMLGLGGGWAYAGAAGCHFVLNPLGIVMLAALVIGVLALLFSAARRIVLRHKTSKTRLDN